MFKKGERAKYIGGSDVAAAIGLSRWVTPLQLYAQKAELVEPEDISEKEHVLLGTELEDFVAKKFERVYKKDTGKEIKVRRDSRTFRHKEYDYMVAHIDRRIVGSEELLECKTCSAYKLDEWSGDEIPQEYIIQVMWYLGILGMKKAYLAVLVGGQKFIWKEIEFDQEMYDELVEKCVEFWGMVESKTPPVVEADDNSFIVKLYPLGNDKIKEASQEVNDAIGLLQQTKAQIKELDDTKRELEAKIKAIIGESAGIRTLEFTAKWINTQASTYTVNKKAGRMLRISKNKIME